MKKMSPLRQTVSLLLLILLFFSAIAHAISAAAKNRTISIDNHHPDNELLMWSVRLNWTNGSSQGRGAMDSLAERVARAAGLVSWGQVGLLTGVYSMVHWPATLAATEPDGGAVDDRPTLAQLRRRHRRLPDFDSVKRRVERLLAESPSVRWFSQEIVRSRHPRSLLDTCNDPFAAYQWHLKSKSRFEFDVNVTGVWDEGIYGAGVTVCLLDDGLDYTNPDLAAAYNPQGSYDFNENDYDPMPSTKSPANHHGTRCAGEIAAKPNNFYCGVGIAPGSRVSMLKILDGTVVDSMEGMAYNYQYHGNYIYSSSWGPPDSGNYIDGPHLLGRRALRNGVHNGRHGYGSIFVVASGNGGYFADNCNFDGYATSEYTVTIGAVTKDGVMPPYAEECACMHGVTVSSGSGSGIVTTDWRRLGGTGCTSSHGGTSAAAPLAAGMIALMLSARPCLSWRDVQHILVLTAEKVDRQIGHYARNGAGLYHSHKHGFGMLSAWRLVQVAKTWDSVPPALYKDSLTLPEYGQLPSMQTVYLYYDNTESKLDSEQMILEHVKVQVSIDHPRRGQLIIGLYSPAGTYSALATLRPHDKSTSGLRWTFATLRCWGESSYGEWRLAVNNTSSQPGIINSWRLVLMGTAMKPADYRAKIRQVRDIVTGKSPAAQLKAKSCPESLPLSTAEGGMPARATAAGRIMAFLRRLPVLFNFLIMVSLCVFVYYTVHTSAAWCRNKYKERQEARSHRRVTPYDYLGGLRATRPPTGPPLLSPPPPPPPPPPESSLSIAGAHYYGSDLPPSYEEAVSESTSLLAHYDARSSSVSIPALSGGGGGSSRGGWQPLRLSRR